MVHRISSDIAAPRSSPDAVIVFSGACPVPDSERALRIEPELDYFTISKVCCGAVFESQEHCP
jgi:hypothetical protein